MSGTSAPGQRTSARTNKGIPPPRLGYGPSTPAGNQIGQHSPTPSLSPSTSSIQRMTTTELETKVSELRQELQSSKQDQDCAENILKEFLDVDETALDSEQLDRYQAGRTMHWNATKVQVRNQAKIKEIQDLISSRVNQPGPVETPKADYLDNKSRRSQTSSVVSYKSSKTKKMGVELAAEERLLELRTAHEVELEPLEKELNELLVQIELETDEKMKSVLLRRMRAQRLKMEGLIKSYEKIKKRVEMQQAIDEKRVMIEEDSDQYLGSDDDSVYGPVRERSPLKNRTSPPVLPDFPPTSHNPFNLPHNVPQGLEQLAGLPAMTNCTINLGTTDRKFSRKLPNFDGDPKMWGTFLSAFERTKGRYDDGDNMARLSEALQGKAKEAVQHLTANIANVPKIMEILQRRFGRPEYVLNYLVDQVKQCQAPQLNKYQSIVDFGTLVEALVTNIESYGKMRYMNDTHLVEELIKKLPGTMKDNWGDYLLEDPDREPTLKIFSKWMDHKVRRAELFITPEMPSSENKPKGKKSSVNAVDEDKDKKKLLCTYCDKVNHLITGCYSFKKLDSSERRNWAREKGLCFQCLKGKHMMKDCPTKDKIKCQVKGCKGGHNTLLHSDFKPRQRENEASTSEDCEVVKEKMENLSLDKKDSSNHVASVNTFSTASLPIIPVLLKGPLGTKKIFALLDSGASCSILEGDIASSLGLDQKPHTFNVAVLGKETRQEKSSLVQIRVAGTYRNAPSFMMKDVRTIPKLGISGINVDSEGLKAKHSHLRSMHVPSCCNAVPKMIIGFDNSRLFAARKILEDRNQEAPCAYKSLLGWYVCESKQAKDSCNLIMETGPDDNLNHMMKDFFSLENIGVKVMVDNHRSQDDKKALQLMEKHTKQLETGRWETCLLWKDEDCQLPESYSMAHKRLLSMERKMNKDPDFARMCQDKFAEYVNKGYLKKKEVVLPLPRENPKLWYLPWFFAIHPSKKPRLVFDGAAKSNGKCLNDFLFKGPDLLESLPGVLMRFRRHTIAVTADIKEMFHQIKLRNEDRPSQTILYRGMDQSKPPDEYEMTVLFFGSASSPSSALYVKTANAMKFQNQYPEVVEAINRDCYMDDFPSGEETVAQAVSLQQVVTSIHHDGGFPMVKWNSNNNDVYNAIPSNIRSEKKELMRLSDKSEVELEKTLGLLWDPNEDCFLFEVKPKAHHMDIFEEKKIPTKREVCSILMSVFDPLGFLGPVKVKGLIIMQEIWKTQIGWDDEVPDEIYQRWKCWMNDLQSVKVLRIPRRLSPFSLKDADDIQLHVFVDASQVAYSAAVFLRICTGESISTPFILGKARVAPLKYLTIPRMELQAAVMGTRLEKTVKTAFSGMRISRTVFWSDSRTVLCWIRSSKGKFNVFVANRIGEILENTEVQSWKWVPTKLNPADAATRSNDLSLSTWIDGPSFLVGEENTWPKEAIQEMQEQGEEINSIVDNFGTGYSTSEQRGLKLGEVLPDIEKFSSWFKLLRATACVIVAARRFRKKGVSHITKDDLEKAKRLWTIKSQEVFEADKKELDQSGIVSKKSRLFKLSPILKDGIIVMDSRIKGAGAEVSSVVRQPPILDPKEKYTKLLVKWFHHTGQHYGQERVINELRQHVWIIDCRGAVRRCKSECLICKKRSALPAVPEMGQLPSGRLEAGKPPFYHCGLDYFGPINVKVRRSIEKRWGVIFTCLATRAVHVDLAHSLDTSDFLNCLIRFMNFRGKPAHLWSDNGTNFVGAEREMREHLQQLDQDHVRATLQVREIEWHFNPPSSPHMGGSWERLIGDVKKILRQMLKAQEPSEELLRTLFAEVTGILNSRPITRTSPDPDDYSCLTPNHLLNIPCVVGASITGKYEDHHRFAKSYERSQLLARQFWERWSKEYVPWLAQRKKWFSKAKPLEVGDIVIVLEDNAPRNMWKTGVITATFPQDGQVRKVEVKMAHVDPKDPKKLVKFSKLIRPAVKIAPLSLQFETYVSGGSMADSGLDQ